MMDGTHAMQEGPGKGLETPQLIYVDLTKGIGCTDVVGGGIIKTNDLP